MQVEGQLKEYLIEATQEGHFDRKDHHDGLQGIMRVG
jgi:hypothetical protein